MCRIHWTLNLWTSSPRPFNKIHFVNFLADNVQLSGCIYVVCHGTVNVNFTFRQTPGNSIEMSFWVNHGLILWISHLYIYEELSWTFWTLFADAHKSTSTLTYKHKYRFLAHPISLSLFLLHNDRNAILFYCHISSMCFCVHSFIYRACASVHNYISTA